MRRTFVKNAETTRVAMERFSLRDDREQPPIAGVADLEIFFFGTLRLRRIPNPTLPLQLYYQADPIGVTTLTRNPFLFGVSP